MRYQAARRPGLWHRFARFNGQLVDTESGAPPIYTSWPLAGTFAGLLNGDQTPAGSLTAPSPVPRYSVSAAPNKRGEVFIYGGTSPTVRDEARYGFGLLAKTADANLARQLVDRMNALDPAPRTTVWRAGF
jgi:hypothetical protein